MDRDHSRHLLTGDALVTDAEFLEAEDFVIRLTDFRQRFDSTRKVRP